MPKIYGYSDDNVVIDGAPYPADEIGCFNSRVQIRFSDETLIEVNYGEDGIWHIDVLARGNAPMSIIECYDSEANPYSDVMEIDADYVWHEVIANV